MPLEKFNLPIGRIVQGNPLVPQIKTDYHTKKAVLDEKGQQINQSQCHIAIPKDAFLREVYPMLCRVAGEIYPINPQTGQPNVHRDFAWKFVDGDSPECPQDSKTPYNVREGYPGHYVIKVSTEAFIPKVFKQMNGAFYEVQSNELKTGDYVVANVDIKVHSSKNGGLYINPNAYELVAIGDEIKGSGGINPEQAFGNRQHQLPAGARPIGSAPAPMAPMAAPAPMMPQPAYAPTPAAAPMAPMPAAPMTAPSPMAPVAGAPLPPPAHDFVQNMGMPQGPQPMAAPYGAPNAMPVQPQGALPVAMPIATPAPASPISGMPMMPQR